MNGEGPQSFVFDEFVLDAESQILTAGGREIHLAKRPFQVLAYLIENRERLVGRDELLDKFWDGHEVYDDALRKTVGAIRKALNDLGKPPRLIETRYGGGYRFIGRIDKTGLNGHSRPPAPAAVDKPAETENPGFRYVLLSVGAVVVISLLAFGFYSFRRSPAAPPPAAPEAAGKRHSIAVLPLRNLTGDPANDYLSDGLTESLINELSRIEDLKVISRNSVFEFKNKDAPAAEIGKKLGVETFLEGGLKRSGDNIRIEARLVDAADGSVIWASDLPEKNIADIFAIQDTIVCRLVADLQVRICGDVPPAARYTKNVRAYQLYLQGLYYRNMPTPENLKKAVSLFEEALRAEPDYALAHEGLATVYMLMEFNSAVPPGTAAPKALLHARKALALDDSLAGANIVLGAVGTLDNYDLDERVRFYTEALRKNPNNRTALLWRSNVFLARGQFEAAEADIRRAQALDPLSYGVWVSVCELYIYWRKPDQAIEEANFMLTAKPNDPVADLFLAQSYLQKGDLQKVSAYVDNAPGGKTTRAVIFAADRDAALRAVAEFAETEDGRNSPYGVASYYGYLGEREKAFEWLEKAYAARQANLVSVKIDPVFDSIRDDPRYLDLLKRVHLE
ncbi:MAG: winged helix-turn-helix domain-containing protein [Acidobacteria bacterium]|nr:winged helix-turn-helix domain-containing protein [Acidobacteriota bacterium]